MKPEHIAAVGTLTYIRPYFIDRQKSVFFTGNDNLIIF
jgi:hypothetical protein